MFEKVMEYFSRKFVLALAALIGSFALGWTEKDLMGWVAAITAILAFYNGSNVYQEYLVNKYKRPKEEVSDKENQSSD